MVTLLSAAHKAVVITLCELFFMPWGKTLPVLEDSKMTVATIVITIVKQLFELKGTLPIIMQLLQDDIIKDKASWLDNSPHLTYSFRK